MTTVRFRINGATAVIATPSNRYVDATGVKLATPVPVALTNGAGTADLAPNDETWCWVLREIGTGGIARYVTVPDSLTTVDYEDLADVDPPT